MNDVVHIMHNVYNSKHYVNYIIQRIPGFNNDDDLVEKFNNRATFLLSSMAQETPAANLN